MSDDLGTAGQPGEPGGPPVGRQGGAGGRGGEGGAGGLGDPRGAGGLGGEGGRGGRGERGEKGDTGAVGPRGPAGSPPPGVTQEEVDFYSKVRQDDIRVALKEFSKRAVAGFLILLVGLVVAFTVSQHDNARDQRNAERNRQQIAVIAKRADNLAKTIQAQRIANIRDSCEATNDRHDKAVRSLRALIPPERTGDERKQSLVVVDALADAVAPKQDCDDVVKRATKKNG
jgi:hypothetical protein